MLKAVKKDFLVKVSSTAPDVPVWRDDENRRVNLTECQVQHIINEAIQGAAKLAKDRADDDQSMKDAYDRLMCASPHSLRVGFVAWAARAGGERAYVQSKLGGRYLQHSPALLLIALDPTPTPTPTPSPSPCPVHDSAPVDAAAPARDGSCCSFRSIGQHD